jgi:hypothetical protein
MTKYSKLLTACCALIALVVTTTAVAGPFRRGRHHGYSAPPAPCTTCGGQGITQIRSCAGKICPVYWYMDHGEYKDWYSVRCPNNACSWSGPGNVQTQGCLEPCDNCQTSRYVDEVATIRKKPHEIQPAIRESGINRANSRKAFNTDASELFSKFIKFRQGRWYVVEVSQVSIRSEVMYVGHEVERDPATVTEVATSIMRRGRCAFEVGVAGFGDTFTVITDPRN